MLNFRGLHLAPLRLKHRLAIEQEFLPGEAGAGQGGQAAQTPVIARHRSETMIRFELTGCCRQSLTAALRSLY